MQSPCQSELGRFCPLFTGFRHTIRRGLSTWLQGAFRAWTEGDENRHFRCVPASSICGSRPGSMASTIDNSGHSPGYAKLDQGGVGQRTQIGLDGLPNLIGHLHDQDFSRHLDARVAGPGQGLKVAQVQCVENLRANFSSRRQVQPVVDGAAAHAARLTLGQGGHQVFG